MTKKFDEKTWHKKLIECSEIKDFLSINYDYYDEKDNHKIIKIGNNVIQISKGLQLSTFLLYFEKMTENVDAFRGFKKIEELYPGYRRQNKIVNEIEALKLFEKQGSAYFAAKNPIEFLANAEHFGLPTRLIDFTRNPYIALFFSMYTELDKKENYYYIACANFSNNLILEELPVFNSIALENGDIYFGFGNEDQYYSFYKKINSINIKLWDFYNKSDINEKDLSIICQRIEEVRESKNNNKIGINALESRKKRCLIFIEPSYTNERIKNQQGLFMYPYDDEINNHINIIKNNVSIIAIHKDYRKDILHYLTKIGITEYKLMPDLASVCSEIIRELRH